jgi:hypothetical protein
LAGGLAVKLKIECTSVYADEEVVNVQDVDVPAPEEDEEGRCEHGHFLSGGTGTCPMPRDQHTVSEDDLEDWGMEHLMQFTGTGRTTGEAGYFVEVLESPERPSLVGFKVEAFG